jgi:hypothetical protein
MDNIVGHHEIRTPQETRMSCEGGHHACVCKSELLYDAIEALAHILAGIERSREGLSHYDRTTLTKKVHGIPGAISVLSRARILK